MRTIGSINAARAVVEGTRNARNPLSTIMLSNAHRARVPNETTIAKAMRRARFALVIAEVRTKAQTISQITSWPTTPKTLLSVHAPVRTSRTMASKDVAYVGIAWLTHNTDRKS